MNEDLFNNFLEGIEEFTDDYFEILKHRNDEDISNERETLDSELI